MLFVQKVIIRGAGIVTSNGEYIRNSDQEARFLNNSNNSHIEHTVDGWFVVDFTTNDQTYLFDHNFQTVIPVGDAIEPIPIFEIVYSGT
jgi:hypothetical protein